MAVVAVPLSADLQHVSGLLSQESDWLHDGGDVLVASSEQGVGRAGCERLNQIEGVWGAGAVTLLPAAQLSVAPGDPISILGVTPGITRVLGSAELGGRALVSEDLARKYGWRVGSHVALGSQPARHQRSGPPDPVTRDVTLPLGAVQVGAVRTLAVLAEEHGSGVVLEQAPTGLADACYVRADLAARESLHDALPALVGADGADSHVTVADRLVGGKYAQDYAALWESRPLRKGPWIAGLLMALTWLLMRWTTRADDGLYATLGAGRVCLLVIREVEFSLHLVPGVAIGLAAAASFAAASGTSWFVLWPEMMRYGLVSALTATAVASIWAFLPRPSPLDALKER
ncbi:hypothetical protein [Nocardioides sp.]|uniref:hypothetical protein n=1 Tax=Nocardioides sp. TaxID=35761 RepID=UPI003D09F6E4